MEGSVVATLASGEGDMDYWEAVLKRLRIQKASVFYEAHQRFLVCKQVVVEGYSMS